jgi:hypothetical protein
VDEDWDGDGLDACTDCLETNVFCSTDCTDADGDSYCVTDDCDDLVPTTHPGAPEVCDGEDDDCNELVDDDELGEDSDGDGHHNVCDNCRSVANAGQEDNDGDGTGDACDTEECDGLDNDGDGSVDEGFDMDFDQVPDCSDNCPEHANAHQEDGDEDQVGDACDNCLFDPNTDQTDADGDGSGEACDCDDGHGAVWAVPGEVPLLDLTYDLVLEETTLTWTVPPFHGGTAPLRYDSLRADAPSDFESKTQCVESDDGSDTRSIDGDTNVPEFVHYLVAAENDCPGRGSLGRTSAGDERLGRACP